ncbi:MAG: methyltransferase domain-containing protein [Acidimicrobiales bacterium]|nr:methyltransferase domain-containing protein [Acidimicrobiales bacterium]
MATGEAWLEGLERRHGRALVAELTTALRARATGEPVDVDAILLADLDLAIDGLAVVGGRHAAWLTWWAEHPRPAERLVDVGCGPGLAACFYALEAPDTEVIGIDRSALAVERADELARRLGVPNVRFEATELHDLDQERLGGAADVVVATALVADVAPELSRAPADPWSRLRSIDEALRGSGAAPADQLAGLLAPGGSLLTLDRWGDTVALAAWWGALAAAGLRVDPEAAGHLRVRGFDGTDVWSRTVARSTGSVLGWDADRFADWALTSLTAAGGTQAAQALAYERVLRSLGPLELVWGREAHHADGSGVERLVVLRADDGEAVAWHATTRGYRMVVTGGSEASVDDYVAQFEAYLNGQLPHLGELHELGAWECP